LKSYYRLMLGRQSRHAVACFEGSFVGSDFLPDIDLTGRLPDARRPFNKEFVPILMAQKPNKTKVRRGVVMRYALDCVSGHGTGRYRVVPGWFG